MGDGIMRCSDSDIIKILSEIPIALICSRAISVLTQL